MRVRTSAAVAAAATLLAIGTATVAGAAPARAGGSLTAQPVPPGAGRLFSSAQIDAHTTWAAGMWTRMNGKAEVDTPMLLSRDDRDGTGWHEVRLPAYDGGSNEINSVAAVPGRAHQAWAVGLADSSQGDGLPGRGTPGPMIADRWDGHAWQSFPVPLPDRSEFGGLTQVGAAAPDDVWAVGWAQILDSATPIPGKPGGYQVEDHFEALAEHWDGHAWTRIAMPDQQSFLPNRMAVGGPDDIWAAGYDGQNDVPEIQHWNGRAWTVETLPSTGLAGEFYAVGVDASGTPWAVGRTVLTETDTGHPLVLRKTGGQWRSVRVPGVKGQLGALAFTPDGVAVAGGQVDGPASFALRYDGVRWHELALPAGSGPLQLNGMSYGAAHGLTVVGDVASPAGPAGAVPLVLGDR
ncbi:hypothetical protein [Streptomyces sp. NPDC020917]|uniref:hypothetical protein n=1 Tax=Streptomyces sp. NPDC020917 TaxID=3365102 RepID=UPI0037BBD6D3